MRTPLLDGYWRPILSVEIFPSETTSVSQAIEIAKKANPEDITIMFTKDGEMCVTHSTMENRDLLWFAEMLKVYALS